jgi:hypothetical protein
MFPTRYTSIIESHLLHDTGRAVMSPRDIGTLVKEPAEKESGQEIQDT